ncbi:unnamed protein product [Spodoptera exigua]|nr:unnamed protein product [Spodoptera exigua]
MLPTYANCVRDGVLNTETPVREIVKGDIVHVQAGDIVPADIRIIESKGFKVDNSSLTGESAAVARSVVICCGDLTALGRVAGLAARLTPAPSPLSREIRRFMRYMSIWALALGLFICISSMFLGYPFMNTIIFVIGIIVANIPEGLQPTITASLTITAQRMVKRNCLVKNLDAVEALGACSVICSDKTGTLTENKMVVLHVWTWNKASVHLETSRERFIVVMKGAPEIILARCLTVATDTKDIILTDDMKRIVEVAIENLAKTGERIMAFADLALNPKEFPLNYSFNSDDVNYPLENLRLLGIMGLMDPPREEVRTAIAHARDAGIRVMMVTGDHPTTARAVALEVGIATNTNCHVVTGNELRNMTPNLLHWTLDRHYEIVEACQREGAVVAVTGDGVNDAPALRQADIGISMGITGSQVSKQTADIILMDDNFATIIVGIEEGRRILDNLKKSVCYILISNVPEIAPVFMFILFSIPLPLGVMTILCVDLGTDMWPAVALAHERAETDVMTRPANVRDRLVTPQMLTLVYLHLGLIEFAAGMYAYFIVMAEFGFYPDSLFGIRQKWDNVAVSDVTDSLGQEWTYIERKEVEQAAQAAYFVAVVLMQMMNGVICRTRYNSLFHVGKTNDASIIKCWAPANVEIH